MRSAEHVLRHSTIKKEGFICTVHRSSVGDQLAAAGRLIWSLGRALATIAVVKEVSVVERLR